MFSKIWLINIILAGVLVVVGASIWDVWQAKEVIAQDAARKPNQLPPVAKAGTESRLQPESAYEDVVAENLFSPDRAEYIPEAADPDPVEEDVRISGEKVVLYGVLMLGDVKKALINNVDTKKDPRSQLWIAEGDQIGNLRVDQIEQDFVVLNDGTNAFNILLYDPEKSKQKARQVKPRGGPEIVNAGAAAESAPSPNVKPGTAPNAKPGLPNAAPAKPSSGFQEKVTISEDGQYEIVDTPFGKIKRKRK